MKKNTCPVCDQTMKYPYYCSHCHKIVLHPNVQEITYFLNERHPQEEDDCSYHGSTVQPSATAGQAGSSGRKQVYQNRTVSGAGSPASRKNPAAGNARRAKASKSRIRTVMIAFAAAYVLASVFSIIQTIVRKANEKESRTAEAYTEVREEIEAASEEYSSCERTRFGRPGLPAASLDICLQHPRRLSGISFPRWRERAAVWTAKVRRIIISYMRRTE